MSSDVMVDSDEILRYNIQYETIKHCAVSRDDRAVNSHTSAFLFPILFQ